MSQSYVAVVRFIDWAAGEPDLVIPAFSIEDAEGMMRGAIQEYGEEVIADCWVEECLPY